MPKNRRGQDVTTVFILLLFCVFAFALLTVLLLGVDVYRGVAQTANDGYGERTCLAYITAKVRHSDNAESIGVGEFGESTSLELTEYFGGEEYVTKIYLHEGNVCELFFQKSLDLQPDAGMPICPAKSLEVRRWENGMLRVDCDSGTGLVTMYLESRCGLKGAEA